MMPKGRSCVVSNGHIRALLTSHGLMAFDRDGLVQESFDAGINRRKTLAEFFRSRGEETDASEAMAVVTQMVQMVEVVGGHST